MFETAKCFFKQLLENKRPIYADEELQSANDELIDKRKWTLILRSNIYKSGDYYIDDMVEVNLKAGLKHRKLTTPKLVEEIDTNSGTKTVPRRSGKLLCAPGEDDRAARRESDPATAIQE